MYKIIFQRSVTKQLSRIPANDRERISYKLFDLAKDPDNKALDITKLTGEPYLRLRVGKWRVVFDRDDTLRVISVEKVGARGGIYK